MITHKTILIISPQEWNSIKVSKHHYADELAKTNNKVYFINPIKSGIIFFSVKKYNNIYVVNIYIPLPYAIKFKLPKIYSFFLNSFTLIFLISNKIKTDIVCDFDNTHQYKSYKIFKSKINIYHPVDATSHIQIKIPTKKPDILFSVSPLILKNQQFNCPKYFINHGLSQNFIQQAHANLLNYSPIFTIKNVGYSGNLDSNLINVEIFEEVINKNKNLNFIFMGPYCKTRFFFRTFSQYSNCFFTGQLSQQELVKKMNTMDMLMYFYKADNKKYFSDNSHKILEYLSTGKIILGNKLLAYENNNLLIQAEDDKEWLNYFNEIVANTYKFIDETKFKQRIEFALEHSYQNQLNKISNYLGQNKFL